MSCSPFDLNDYYLDELAGPQQRQVEAHVKTCPPCREELDRLRVMGAALRSVAEEEIPQRIAFVSDKIFEPSPWRRRLAAFWNSGARLGFASAALLSASVVIFAFRPAPAPVVAVRQVQAPAPAPVAQNAAARPSEAEIDRRIQEAVDKAVEIKTAALQRELKEARATLLVAAEGYDYQRAKAMAQKSGSYTLPASASAEVKQ
jgi:anti-sigma factor RsiW